jgi:hypothetical protein
MKELATCHQLETRNYKPETPRFQEGPCATGAIASKKLWS